MPKSTEADANFIPTIQRTGFCVIITLWLVILVASLIPTAKCCASTDKCNCFYEKDITPANATATTINEYNATCLKCDKDDTDKTSTGCVVHTNSYIYCGTGHYHQPTAVVCYVIVGILITLGLCCTMNAGAGYVGAGI